MCQKTDLPFQKMLKRARKKKLDLQDIQLLNQRLAIDFFTIGVIDIVIIIQ